MRIGIDHFNGIAPRYAPDKLPATAAQVAQNCRFASGAVDPLYKNKFITTPSKAGVKKTIYWYERSYWFHWLEDVDILPSPLPNDAYRRVYWTGEGAAPRMAGNDIVTGGGTDYPTNYYTLGVPAPVSGEEITFSPVLPSDPTTVDSVAYVYTYVSGYGEEGPNSSPSAIVDVTPGDTVNLTIPGTGPAGAYNITAKRIYRLNNGVYQFLAEIPASQTTYADSVLPENLGSELVTTDWDPPNPAMIGLVSLPNGVMAGFFDNVVCFSEPYLPHAWPVKYRAQVFGKVVAMGVFGSTLIVLTDSGAPYLFTGSSPDSMAKEHAELGYACLSKRGVVDMGPAVVYPSDVGLIMAGVGVNKNITESVLSQEEWAKFSPSTINAYRHGTEYVAFYDTGTAKGGFIFDIRSQDLVTLDWYASAGFNDAATGDLYLVVGDDIVKFDDASQGKMTARWRSKKFISPTPTNLGAMQIFADLFPVQARVFASGYKVFDAQINNDGMFRLPGGFRAYEWEVEIEADAAVNRIAVASRAPELKGV